LRTLFLIFLISSFTSCAFTFSSRKIETVRTSDKYFTENILGTPQYYIDGAEHQRKKRRYYKSLYLVKSHSNENWAQINNKSVELIIEGNYTGAISLLERVSTPSNGIIVNNLAAAYAASGQRDTAKQLYLEACQKDPQNKYFQHNFNSF
jgi:tetratricopeptide (TPR) repeat protein